MRNWQTKTTISLATLGFAVGGALLAGGAAAWCPDPEKKTVTWHSVTTSPSTSSSLARVYSVANAPRTLIGRTTASPALVSSVSNPLAITTTTTAAPVAVTWQDSNSQSTSDSRTVHIITHDSQDDEDGHSISIKRSMNDGEVDIELEIDGEKYDVESMDEVREILREKGIDHEFDFRFGDEHWNQLVPHVQMPRLELRNNLDWPQLSLQNPRGAHTLTFFAGEQPKAMLGIHMSAVGGALAAHLDLDEGQGVLITSVVDDSPAEQAGFQEHDIVTAARVGDDDEWQSVNQESLRELIADQEPETMMAFQIIRAGNGMELEATLEKWDGPRMGITRQFFGPSAPSAGTTHQFWTQPRTFQHQWRLGGENDQWIQPFEFNEKALEQYMERLERQMEEFEKYFERHMEQLHEHQDQLQRRLEEHRERTEQPVDA